MTTWRLIFAVCVFAIGALGSTLALAQQAPRASATAQDMRTAVLQRDLAYFLGIFEGRYDNEQQVFFDADLKTPPDARNNRIHSIFRKVDLPAFGENVFYVEQYADGDPTQIYRQRIYVFSIDSAENAIKLVIHAPKDAALLAGAYRDTSKLAGLEPAQTDAYPGCEVYWRREEAQFRGTMKPGACRIESRRSGRTIVVTDDLLLTPDSLWIQDRAVDAQGAYVYGNRAGVPHKLRKVRSFSCWVFVLRGAHGDSGEGNTNWQMFRDVWVHDQGGVAAVTTNETPARTVRLRLRDVAWPYGTNRPSLTLYALVGASDRAVSYAWTEGGGARVGLNLRWMQASCTHAPERLWDGS